MRRIAFIAVMSLGLIGSGWFVAQPAAEPPTVGPVRAPVVPVQVAAEVAAPTIPRGALQLAGEKPSIPLVATTQAASLQQALGAEACPSEAEALAIVSRLTSSWDFGDAARAIELASIPRQDCESVRAALARSRGAVEATNGWLNAPRQDEEDDRLIVGDGFALGGDSGPGYRS